jgi:predicted alpha/beta hydrolase family esterase
MDRTLLIRHNWNDRNESKWLFWLEKKLTELGFSVSLADLPDAVKKNTTAAVGEIQAVHGITPQHTHIVRHDPGCLTLLKYCEQLLKQPHPEPTLLIAGIPKYNPKVPEYKLLGGTTDNLTLDTIEIKLVVVYGGELHKALK